MSAPDADGSVFDSFCRRCLDDDQKVEATGRVRFPDGTIRYYCVDHLTDLHRFGVPPGGIDDPPVAVECRECRKLTLRGQTTINRLCIDCQDKPGTVDPDDYIDAIDEFVADGKGEDEDPAPER